MKSYQTQEELDADLDGLELRGVDRARVACNLIGHSRKVSLLFGEVYCCRCLQKIGDRIMSSFDLSDKVVVGHGDDCDDCKQIAESFTWMDTYLIPK